MKALEVKEFIEGVLEVLGLKRVFDSAIQM